MKRYAQADTPNVDYCYDGRNFNAGWPTSTLQNTTGAPRAYPLLYTHCSDNSLASVTTYPSTAKVTNCYDRHGWQLWVSGTATELDCRTPSGSISTFATVTTYRDHGAPGVTQFGNGQRQHDCYLAYNLALSGRRIGTSAADPGDCSHQAGDPMSLQWSYSWGADNGMPAAIDVKAFRPAQPATPAHFRNWYAQDRAGRVSADEAFRFDLTAAVYLHNFQYDAAGNRIVQNGYPSLNALSPATPTSLAQYDAASNRLIKSQAASTNDVIHDSAGNQTYHPLAGSYSFDSENRLYQSNVTGQVATYSYDGDGRRVRQTTPTGTRVYVYDAFGQVAAEYATQPASGSGDRYLFHDHLGSVRLALDAAGNCVERWDYHAFGETIPATTAYLRSDIPCYGSGASANSLLFTGQTRDESGLDYFGARYLAAVQGRFMSPDAPFADQKSGDPQSWNLYSYVRNRPLSFVDPNGRALKLSSDKEQRDKLLAGLREAVGSEAGSYLFANEQVVTTEGTSYSQYYLGVYTNGPDGKGPDFASINPSAAGIASIIEDKRVVDLEVVKSGTRVIEASGIGAQITTAGASSPSAIGPGLTYDAAAGGGRGRLTVTVLDPASAPIGLLPSSKMSNGRPGPATLGQVIAHELGHVKHRWSHPIVQAIVSSNDMAVFYENRARVVANKNAPLRTKH